MSDLGDIFSAHREESRERRANNRAGSAQILADRGIPFVTHNDGAHLVIKLGRWRFDFWPGTGKWWKKLQGRQKHQEGRGVFPLLKQIDRILETKTMQNVSKGNTPGYDYATTMRLPIAPAAYSPTVQFTFLHDDGSTSFGQLSKSWACAVLAIPPFESALMQAIYVDGAPVDFPVPIPATSYLAAHQRLARLQLEAAGGPVFDLIAHLRRQAAFSEKTFGPGARTQGVVDHIRKELDEVLAAPGDVTEWVDLIILALDGAWRAGHTPEAIAAAIEAKQTKNEGRTWPDWRTADPTKAIEHDRSAD